MIYVTSDIHGRMDCLEKLLDCAHFNDDENNWLYILGDVIDRNNNGGVDILKWLLLQPNVQLILGNHEQMLLSNKWIFREVNEDSTNALDEKDIALLSHWKSNGGDCTMKALAKQSRETRQDIIEYLEECPIIESVSVNDRRYILVHGGLGNYSKGKKLRDYTPNELLWDRPTFETKYDSEKYVVIFGHTPTGFYSSDYKNRMIVTDDWWNIDTGAAMNGGRPMLLCLDDLSAYYIEDDGTVLKTKIMK